MTTEAQTAVHQPKPLTFRFASLSASGLYRAEQCPASYAIPLRHRAGMKGPVGDGGDPTAAERGTYIHSVLEWRLRGATLPAALAKGAETLSNERKRRGDPKHARKPHHTWVAWASSHDPHDILPPGYAWVPEQRWGVDLAGLQVDGTPDAVGVRGTQGYVVDWKTTQEPSDTSRLPAEWILRRERYLAFRAKAHKLQALFHAHVFLEKMPRVAEVTTDVAYLGPRGQQWGAHSDLLVRGTDGAGKVRLRLLTIARNVQAARAARDPEDHARPGDACLYCDARGVCDKAIAAGV